MHYYTLKEAAAAIAAEMHPEHHENRAEAQRCYSAALDHAVGTNSIVYRDPVTRLPLQRTGIAASFAAHVCVVSSADLNAWLDRQGVGVSVDTADAAASGAAGVRPVNPGDPTSSELAAALGPFLKSGRDRDWLESRLKDALRYPRLEKYRKMDGKTARWVVGGVTLYLIEAGEMTYEQATAAFTKHYPESLSVIERHSISTAKPAAASWIVSGLE